MLHMYGCPMHLGVGDQGLIQSLKYLNEHYSNLSFPILPEIRKEEDQLPNLKNLNSVAATCEGIAAYAYKVLHDGNTPLFIAGDHSSVMGSISASSAYAQEKDAQELGLIWIDAHPDINTDSTTVTGNIHGMPVAALLGLGTSRLTRFLTDTPKLKPENIIMLGLRDIDPPEQIILDDLKIRYYTYEQICKKGLDCCLKESISALSHLSAVHVSFDIDSMDPKIMPGVSVPVPGGFTIPETEQIFHAIIPALPVIACDIVEFNCEHDQSQQTSDFVDKLVKLLQELFAI